MHFAVFVGFDKYRFFSHFSRKIKAFSAVNTALPCPVSSGFLPTYLGRLK